MRYQYECVNEECRNNRVPVNIVKPMVESSRVEICEVCGNEMKRIYKVGGIVTGDGCK